MAHSMRISTELQGMRHSCWKKLGGNCRTFARSVTNLAPSSSDNGCLIAPRDIPTPAVTDRQLDIDKLESCYLYRVPVLYKFQLTSSKLLP